MNPHNFYIIVSRLILLQLTLIGIYKGKENHTFPLFSSKVHLNFTSIVFYGFEWMISGPVQ